MTGDSFRSDRETARRVLTGDAEAYAALVRQNMDRLYSFCLSLLSDPTEAEDAAQEVFVKAYRSLKTFQGDARFSTWLTRIAHNHCMDVLRKRSRRKTDSWDALVEKEGEKAAARLWDESAGADIREKVSLAQQVLSRLPEDYRTVLTLRETQDLSYEEIAEMMDCSLDSVKARLRRARVMLRELFERRTTAEKGK